MIAARREIDTKVTKKSATICYTYMVCMKNSAHKRNNRISSFILFYKAILNQTKEETNEAGVK